MNVARYLRQRKLRRLIIHALERDLGTDLTRHVTRQRDHLIVTSLDYNLSEGEAHVTLRLRSNLERDYLVAVAGRVAA